jgi:hypothetical protein
MIALLTAALALGGGTSATAADGAYRGRDPDGHRISVVVRDQHVARLTVAISTYRCALFGEIGPLVVTIAPVAPIAAATGYAQFTRGPLSERLSARVWLTADGGASAIVRLRGTIATGDRCRSGALRFAPTPRRA